MWSGGTPESTRCLKAVDSRTCWLMFSFRSRNSFMPTGDGNTPRPTAWTDRDHLIFDIGYAFPRSSVRGARRAFDEDDRRRIATAIVEHLELCGWRFQRSAPSVGHGSGRGGLVGGSIIRWLTNLTCHRVTLRTSKRR